MDKRMGHSMPISHLRANAGATKTQITMINVYHYCESPTKIANWIDNTNCKLESPTWIANVHSASMNCKGVETCRKCRKQTRSMELKPQTEGAQEHTCSVTVTCKSIQQQTFNELSQSYMLNWAVPSRNVPLESVGTAKAQISLHKCAVWSGPILSATRIIGYHRMYQWREKALFHHKNTPYRSDPA